MNELIWVGNTLYPRGLVFAVIGVSILVVACMLACVFTYLTK